MKTRIIKLAPLFALLVAAGCSHMDPNLGSRVQQNTAAQTVNPKAGATDKKVDATLDGPKAEALLQRYRKETPDVKDERLIKNMSTTD